MRRTSAAHPALLGGFNLCDVGSLTAIDNPPPSAVSTNYAADEETLSHTPRAAIASMGHRMEQICSVTEMYGKTLIERI
jgi:hypothetical protein